ncbi:hypothetical protein PCYB_031580 [Plasmodium cynomolgi strain B]|uniref:Uncharacterized protein n=1 Tax=Plasmodium cynomolgi (strain B) TaxID=1120755 RepID=K6US39_PLACD|nr:hypothetical protein PCYB_031580 [Plasmodium cynomolgi strain B]GAB64745.1 hypothetical protein PCYB_031580 [Plasmodium cynomolgi strain B]
MSMFKGMLIKSSERSTKGKNPNAGKGSSAKEAQLARGSSTLSSKRGDSYLDLEDLAPSYSSSVAATDKGGNHVQGDEAVTLPLHGDKDEEGSFERPSGFYKIAQIGNTPWCGSYERGSNNNESANGMKRSSCSHPNWSDSRNEFSSEPYEGYLECAQREVTNRSDSAISPEEGKRHIENFPEQILNPLNDLLTLMRDFFMTNPKQWNKNKVKRILDELTQNKIHQNVLIVVYYFTYEAYANRVLLNLKEEYNCDLLIHKFFGKIHKIRKKRKKCKEEEKVLIINEKLDTAHEMQKQIFTYNLELSNIENYITDLFRKKKQRKIIQKEEDIKTEEENIKAKERSVEESKEELNKAEQVISSTYEKQLHKIDEEIDALDRNIKELEEIITIKKSQREDAIRRKKQLEKERETEMKTLLQKQSDLNTSINFIKNTTSLMDEKKKFVEDEKEKTKKVVAQLKEAYQNSCQKKIQTNRLLCDLKNVVRNLYNSDEECKHMCEDNSRRKSFVGNYCETTDGKGTSPVRDENAHTINATATKGQEQASHHLDASNLLKKIFLLKKHIFDVEKNMNSIKGKKKQLTIDISQFNCEMDNINIKKENLKNKKKILLKNKMLSEIKNTINELEELDQTEEVILKQLEDAKGDMSLLRKDHLRMKEQKEALKRRLFRQERKLLKREIRHVRGDLNRDQGADSVVTPPADEGVANGERDDVASGERDDVAKGVRDDVANGERDDVANGERDDVVSGERDDVANGERNNVVASPVEETNEEEAFPFSEESEQSEGGESSAAFSQMLHQLEKISENSEDEEDQYMWSDQEEEDTSQSDEEEGERGGDGVIGVSGGTGENGETGGTSETGGAETPLPSDGEKSGPSEDNSDSGDHGDGAEVVTDVVTNGEEKNTSDSFPRSNTHSRDPLDQLEKFKLEEGRIFERILEKYKSFCNLSETVDHHVLEKEIRQVYRDITREQTIFKNKKLLTLRKRKRVLRRYYHYVSDNSEEEDLNG